MPEVVFPLDSSKKFTDQEKIGHNRWHYAIPPAVTVAVTTVGVLLVATIVQMVFGELYPKNLAIAAPETLALALARTGQLDRASRVAEDGMGLATEIAEFAELAEPMPSIPQMAAIWGPLGQAQANIVGGADPASTMEAAGEEIAVGKRPRSDLALDRHTEAWAELMCQAAGLPPLLLPAAIVPPMLLSRLVLGVHYPTDVTAGAAIGAASAAAVIVGDKVLLEPTRNDQESGRARRAARVLARLGLTAAVPGGTLRLAASPVIARVTRHRESA